MTVDELIARLRSEGWEYDDTPIDYSERRCELNKGGVFISISEVLIQVTEPTDIMAKCYEIDEAQQAYDDIGVSLKDWSNRKIMEQVKGGRT